MKYRVTHTTQYEYGEAAAYCHNIAHLSPRPDGGQICTGHFLTITPQPAIIEQLVDHFGNLLQYFSIETPHKEMVITATSIIESNPIRNDLASQALWRNFNVDLSKLPADEQPEVRELSLDSPMIPRLPALREYARPSFETHPEIKDAATDIMRRIHADFKYDPDSTTLATPLTEVLEHRSGVCQDFAHLAIGCLRSFGIAARYVSGYLETLPPEGKERLVGADASHAWLSVFAPDAGWIDLDPTNNQYPDHRYITLGWGRDYSDVPPLKGVIYGGSSPAMKVSVDVEPLT